MKTIVLDITDEQYAIIKSRAIWEKLPVDITIIKYFLEYNDLLENIEQNNFLLENDNE